MSSNYSIAVLLHSYYKLTKGNPRLGVPITAVFDILPQTVHPTEILEVILDAYESGSVELPEFDSDVADRLSAFQSRHFHRQPWTPVIEGVPRYVLVIDPDDVFWVPFSRWFSDEKPTRASTAKADQQRERSGGKSRESNREERTRHESSGADIESLAEAFYKRTTGMGLPVWLQGVKTENEARKRFRFMATKLHPDRESDTRKKLILTRAFQNFMADWEKAREHPMFPH